MICVPVEGGIYPTSVAASEISRKKLTYALEKVMLHCRDFEGEVDIKRREGIREITDPDFSQILHGLLTLVLGPNDRHLLPRSNTRQESCQSLSTSRLFFVTFVP
jgi:hypothetical protein